MVVVMMKVMVMKVMQVIIKKVYLCRHRWWL